MLLMAALIMVGQRTLPVRDGRVCREQSCGGSDGQVVGPAGWLAG